MILNKANLEEILKQGKIQAGPLSDLPEKIIQFGEGNFLRAFIDWMINEMNSRQLFNGRAVVVQPLAQGMADAINAQDGLYTLLLRGVENGEVTEKNGIITSISRVLNPYINYTEFLGLAEQPQLRFIISNTTEAGIEYISQEYPADKCPASYPAKVAVLLHKRFEYFKGAPDKGMIMIPCELIEENGNSLKNAVLRHSADWNLGAEFDAWLEKHNHFFNTLVDRIVPGYPGEEADQLRERFGYTDAVMDAGELFHFFVIEGDERFGTELPFTEAGLNVKWTNDQQPYRTRKVRILNGAHTLSVLAAYMAGFNTVKEMVDDKRFSALLNKAIFEEIIPTIDLPQDEKVFFANAVLERFANPYIRHMLLSISLNSVSKFKVRVLPSLLRYHDITGKLPAVLVFSLAALIMFYKGKYNTDGKYTGSRNGDTYEINDGADVLEFFSRLWNGTCADPDTIVRGVLANQGFWGMDLTTVPGLEQRTGEFLQCIMLHGATETIDKLV